MPPASTQWYCKPGGLTSGPFTLEELEFLVARGKLSAEDQVRQGTTGQWVPAHSVHGLFNTTSEPTNPVLSTPARSSRPIRKSRATEPKEPREHPQQADATGTAQAASEPRKVPSPPPVPKRGKFNKPILIGTGIGAAVVLLLLLLLLLLHASRSSLIAGSGGDSTGGSTGAGAGDEGGGEEGTVGGTSAPGNDQETSAAGSHQDASAAEKSDRDHSATESNSDKPTSAEGDSGDPSTEQPIEAPDHAEDASSGDPPEEEPPPDAGVFSIRKLTTPEVAEPGGMFGGRSSEARSRLAQREGGTPESEATVEQGLEWLAEHQDADGRWCLHAFQQTKNCQGQCGHPGQRSDFAATGLALLPFLGAGQTHKTGKYRTVVQKGLNWLIDNQKKDGSFLDFGRMYDHGQVTIVLCEALAMTRDKRLKNPAQRATDFTVEAQHAAGGWRYTPGMPGDTSVLGWQIMALRSAQTAELDVPKQTSSRARDYLDSVQTDEVGSLYTYMPGGGPRPTMTAEGLLCRQYTGWPKDHHGLKSGVKYLVTNMPDRVPDIYYWYYATQVMHHTGGPQWKKWNDSMREILIKSQEKEGHQAGSWTPRGGHDRAGGRIYVTSLAICTLEVYYRHLPLYRNVP